MRETELLPSTGAHEDSCWQFKASRDGAAAIESDFYWKPNAGNKICNLSVYINVSVSLFQSVAVSLSLSMSFCGTVDQLCRNIAYMYVTIMYVCANQISHTTQFKTSNCDPYS